MWFPSETVTLEEESWAVVGIDRAELKYDSADIVARGSVSILMVEKVYTYSPTTIFCLFLTQRLFSTICEVVRRALSTLETWQIMHRLVIFVLSYIPNLSPNDWCSSQTLLVWFLTVVKFPLSHPQ